MGRVRFDTSRQRLRRHARPGDRRLSEIASRVDHDLPLLAQGPPNDVVARELQFLQERLDDARELALIRDQIYQLIVDEEKVVGGQLGRPSGARFRTYERLKQYAEDVKGSLFDTPRSGISNEKLAELAISLHDDDRLCQHTEEGETKKPQLICSLGLAASAVIG